MTLASRYLGHGCGYVHSGQEINIFDLHMDIVTVDVWYMDVDILTA